MLFNSYEFLFVYLPAVVAGFALLRRASHNYALLWLTVASFAFYGYWQPSNLPILIASVLGNFAVGYFIVLASGERSRTIMIGGIAANLIVLGYYKYAAFLVGMFNGLAGASYPLPQVELPVGISFFTFTQIAFLVDAYRRRLADDQSLANYALFVTYFPHLIAGPILHHKQMMDQFARPELVALRSICCAVGATMFAIGLSKKLLLADPLGAVASPIFDAARSGTDPSFLAAWVGALSYTFQLYFDFSGYSDMAIGLSLLFGIAIPINFASPYKATNIIEFWRRWHISLSTFLRDYLYIPLGGNKHGPARRYLNLMITMVLGGLWHGASWTFVVWGALHGFYLFVNHAWRAATGGEATSMPARFLGGVLTFLAVVVAWVFFRAETFDAAIRILTAMASVDAAVLSTMSSFASDRLLAPLSPRFLWPLLAFAMLVAFCLPNSNELGGAVRSRLEAARDGEPGGIPLGLTAAAYGVLFGLGIVSLGLTTQFLYFQF